MQPSWAFAVVSQPGKLPAYSKFIGKVSKDYPRMLLDAIYLAAMGHHFEKIARQQIAIHDFLSFLRGELETLEEAVWGRVSGVEELRSRRQASFERAQRALRSPYPMSFATGETGWRMRCSPSGVQLDSRANEVERSAVA